MIKHYIIKVSHETIPNKFLLIGIFCRRKNGATITEWMAMLKKNNKGRTFIKEEITEEQARCGLCQ